MYYTQGMGPISKFRVVNFVLTITATSPSLNELAMKSGNQRQFMFTFLGSTLKEMSPMRRPMWLSLRSFSA